MAYLKLFHGRASPDEQLDGWGDAGPIFGPFPYFHTTYGQEICFSQAEQHTLHIVDGEFVFYDDVCYADWSVFDGPVEAEEQSLLAEFEAPLAQVPQAGLQPVAEDGNVNPNVLWTDLVAAVEGGLEPSAMALASALLEWLRAGGSPPAISIQLGGVTWTPRKSIRGGIVATACEGLKSDVGMARAPEAGGTEMAPMLVNWYQPEPNEVY